MTADATTGPANVPLPTSSTPHIVLFNSILLIGKIYFKILIVVDMSFL